MANRKTVLIWHCKTENGWRRYPAVMAKNGRPRHGWALVRGEEKHYPEGRYQVRYYEGSRMIYLDAGEQPGGAMAVKQQRSHLLIVHGSAEMAGVRLVEEPGRLNLERELGRFLEAARGRGAAEAAEVYEAAADEFLAVTARRFADEIVSDDIARYHAALRARGCSDRTIFNRHRNLMAFLRFCALDIKKLAPVAPRYERTIPEVYSEDELRRFFDALARERRRDVNKQVLGIAYETLLKCGLREQELVYLEWPLVDLKRGMLRVQSNPRFGFRVKDGEQREVPIPGDLLAKLRAYRESNPTRKMVVGTRTDRPNTKLLFTLKNRVRAAGLNCGACEECRERDECSRWFLHKFRATYITRLIRSGMDLRTIMRMSGHSDLASVMRYLAPAGDDAVREHISGVKWM